MRIKKIHIWALFNVRIFLRKIPLSFARVKPEDRHRASVDARRHALFAVFLNRGTRVRAYDFGT